jgi:hypothetical protein
MAQLAGVGMEMLWPLDEGAIPLCAGAPWTRVRQTEDGVVVYQLRRPAACMCVLCE